MDVGQITAGALSPFARVRFTPALRMLRFASGDYSTGRTTHVRNATVML